MSAVCRRTLAVIAIWTGAGIAVGRSSRCDGEPAGGTVLDDDRGSLRSDDEAVLDCVIASVGMDKPEAPGRERKIVLRPQVQELKWP